MPPYQFAQYSLGANNGPIIQTLREIYIEEMHHMPIAGNLLEATGVNPVISTPDFVPSFPTHLPGTVASQLIVPLAPFSKSVVEDGEFYRRIPDTFETGGDDPIVDKTGAN